MRWSRLRYHILVALWPLGKVQHRFSGLPLIGPLLASYDPADSEAVLIPIHQEIRGTESVVLPYPLLRPLIERASARTILHHCPCRQGEHCQTYPRDIGCLLLGDGGAAIDPARGRPATVEQALAHMGRATAAGLVPTILHSAFDAYLFDIPYRKMLAICFCCDCCCTIRHGLRLAPDAYLDTVQRLPGLTVRAGSACVGGGTCVAVCPTGAISLGTGQGGRVAHVDDGLCAGCGRCVVACPQQAMELCYDGQGDVLERLLSRIKTRTDIGIE